MTSPVDKYINAISAAVPSLESTEHVHQSAPKGALRRYVEAYAKRRIGHAYVALEEGDHELVVAEIRMHLRENHGVTPWARHLLRRFIGEV